MLDDRYVRELAGHASVTTAIKRGAATPAPQRERGLWSFLTWSFFLSQIAAGTMFIGNAAKAGDNDDLGSGRDAANPSPGASSKALPAIDARPLSLDDASSQEARSSTPAQTDSSLPHGTKVSNAEAADFELEPNLAAQIAELTGSNAASGSAPAASDAGNAPPTPVVPIVDAPENPVLPIISDVLPPVIETVDELIDSLGPLLNDILVPVVGTVEKLVAALAPTVDQLLAPVETIVEGVTGAVAPVLDQALAPVIEVADGVLEAATPLVETIIEPVGDMAGTLLALADPVLDDVVDPLVAPVADIADTLQPVIEPVIAAVAPLVDIVEPALEPVVEALAPVLEPVAELADHLPLDIGNSGLLDGILGVTDAVASPGEMDFPADSAPASNDIFQAGTYTDYGLALHGDTSDNDAGGVEDLIENVALPVIPLLGDDDDTGNGLPNVLAGLQLEINLRGLGDGLM